MPTPGHDPDARRGGDPRRLGRPPARHRRGRRGGARDRLAGDGGTGPRLAPHLVGCRRAHGATAPSRRGRLLRLRRTGFGVRPVERGALSAEGGVDVPRRRGDRLRRRSRRQRHGARRRTRTRRPAAVPGWGLTVAVRVFHRDESEVRLPMIAADARLVVWPGVGAYTANMNYVRMLPDEANVPHVHAESEETIFVLSGEA